MYDLLQALKVSVVKELLLEVRTGSFGGRALRRCQRHVAQYRNLHLAVDSWCVLSPVPVRVGPGTESASKKGPESQVSIAEAVRIGNEPVGVRLRLVVKGISRVQR